MANAAAAWPGSVQRRACGAMWLGAVRHVVTPPSAAVAKGGGVLAVPPRTVEFQLFRVVSRSIPAPLAAALRTAFDYALFQRELEMTALEVKLRLENDELERSVAELVSSSQTQSSAYNTQLEDLQLTLTTTAAELQV